MVDEKIETAISSIDFPEEIYKQNEAPTDAEEGALWLDLDEQAAVSGGGVSSWNDLMDKPFNSEVREILPETMMEIFYDDVDTGINIIPVEFTVEVGKEYIITYNGVKYTCVNNKPDTDELNGYMWMGNLGAVDENFPSSNEPFVLAYGPIDFDEDANPINYTWVIYPLDGSTSVTLSIAEEIVHKIDPKFLPTHDWNASEGEPGHVLNRPFYSEVVSTVLIDNQTYPVDQELYHNFPLITGQSYHVVFDGVEYDEIAKTFDAGGMTIVYLGNVGMFDVDQDNGMPYTIMYIDGTGTGVVPSGATGEQFTVSISTIGEVVHKLPEKYLPETTPLYITIVDSGEGFYFTIASVSLLEEAYAKGREIIAKYPYNHESGVELKIRLYLSAVADDTSDNLGKGFTFYSNQFGIGFSLNPNRHGGYDVTKIEET